MASRVAYYNTQQGVFINVVRRFMKCEEKHVVLVNVDPSDMS